MKEIRGEEKQTFLQATNLNFTAKTVMLKDQNFVSPEARVRSSHIFPPK
jgi:hypothetical protein